jgi:membrane fusion protein, multidrug efflux system
MHQDLINQNGRPDSPETGQAAAGRDAPGRKPASRKRLWIGIGCAVLVLIILVVVRKHSLAAKAAAAAGHAGPGAVPVVAGQVQQKDVPIYLDGLGTVQAFNTVGVHVQVNGQLIKVAFVEGQDVRAGDLLAQIDPAPFQAQVEQAEAKKAQDGAQLANARVDLKRDAAQLASNIVAQQVYDTQQALVDELDAAVKADQAAIDYARVQLGYTTITSPLDGRTGIRLVDQGNIVHSTDTNSLVVVTQIRPISVVFTLPEQTLGDIQQHTPWTNLTVLAVDRDNSTVLGQGTLAVIKSTPPRAPCN